MTLHLDRDYTRDESGRFASDGSSGGASESSGSAGSSPDGAQGTSPRLGTERPVPIKVKSVAEGVERILKGETVELQDLSQVHTVLSKLGALAREAKSAGKDAKDFDLCKVTVSGASLFCGSSLKTKAFPDGVPRIAMPQLKGTPMEGSRADKIKNAKGQADVTEAFVSHLKDVGIKVGKVESVPASHLRATQAQLGGTAVSRMMTDPTYDPGSEAIFVSRDNYVLDGHHRWAAVVGRDAEDGKLGTSKMNVVRVDAPMSELYHRAKTFTEDYGIKPSALGANANKHLAFFISRLRAIANQQTAPRPMTYRDKLLFLLDKDEHGYGSYPRGEGPSASKGSEGLKAPNRPLNTEEKQALDEHLAGERTKLVGKNPTGQNATDLATLAQPSSAYPKANDGAVKHSAAQFAAPGTPIEAIIDAMETGKPGVLTPERQKLHDTIVRQFTRQATPVENPSVLMLGGGPASGKSSGGALPENSITVDPDAIRLLIPDYRDKAHGENPKQSAAFTHEEASALAKRIATTAGKSHNLVIDGTGDNSTEKMIKKITALSKAGQPVSGRYATNDVETAIKRAAARSEKPPFRAVPETTMRETHAGVSRVLPDLMKRDVFKHVELWDSNGPQEKGGVLVMTKEQGKDPVYHDKAKWDAFLAKAEVK